MANMDGEQGTGEHGTSGQDASGQNASEHGTAKQTTADHDAAGQTTGTQDAAGQSTTGQDAADPGTANQTTTGQGTTGQGTGTHGSASQGRGAQGATGQGTSEPGMGGPGMGGPGLGEPGLGEPGPGEPGPGEPGPGEHRERGYRRLARDADRRLLAGVCTGLGRYTGIDPVVFRVGFAILVLAHGQGIFLYLAAALLMPASPSESSLAEQLFKRWFDAQAIMSILGALLCVSVAFTLLGGAYTDTMAALVVFGLVLVAAHSRGTDLVAAARSVPERLAGHPPEPSAEGTRSEEVIVGGVSLSKDTSQQAPTSGGLPEGMIDLAAYSATRADALADEPAAAPKTRKKEGCGGSAPAAAITLLAAMATGAAMIPIAKGYPAPDSWMIVMAPALAVVGLGLVIGGWFRTNGLTTAGTLLTLGLLTTTVVGDMPRNADYGDIDWHPTDISQTTQPYKVGIGQGDLDLTALPMDPGQHVTIDAQVGLGGLAITLPPAARVIVDARITLGDLRIQYRTTSGPNAKVTRVLEPETLAASPPVIELRIRGKIGDVDVHRA